jgi:hypothetical protein
MTMTAAKSVQTPAGEPTLGGVVDDELIARLAGEASARR